MPELRVIGGTAKNKSLKVPESARPIVGKVKRATFDILGELIQDKNVMDLFAGAGSMGIEALSRGAAFVTFVDNDPEAIYLIKQNLKNTGFTEQTKVYLKPAIDYVRKSKEEFDVIFIDPPFDSMEKFPLRLLTRVMHANSVIIFRKARKDWKWEIPSTLEVIETRKYGNSQVLWLKKAEGSVKN